MALLVLLACSASAGAADVPRPGKSDSRVRFVRYAHDAVTVLRAQRGTVTRVVLAPDEEISSAATGFNADCQRAESEWCIHADKGSNQVWIKAREGATHNNLELRTNLRDYSFDLRVIPDRDHASTEATDAAMFRVVFEYPPVAPQTEATPEQRAGVAAAIAVLAALERKATTNGASRESELLEERLSAATPAIANQQYTMEVLSGSEDIAPAQVFDDGRFTYFGFGKRELPAIFFIDQTGEEARVPYHMVGDLIAVHRTGRRFVARLGSAAVGIWNEAFDPELAGSNDGTSVPGVERVLKIVKGASE